MNKSGFYIVKLVSIGFVVILSGTCNKPENNTGNDPCHTSVMQRINHCFATTPVNGALVSPTYLTLKWIGLINSAFSLYFGTNKDSLQCISQQSAMSFDLKNLDSNTTYYWQVFGSFPCRDGCSTGISSFTTVPDTNLSYFFTKPGFTHLKTPPKIDGKECFEGL